ncbi:MAG: DEAD/DEAH box helicase family protein, partial [Candidatus Hodarchaeales archaeon]
IEKILRTSISKLNSINRIVKLEYETLKDNLRMVILTDYIRKEFLPRNEDELTPLSKLGVVPIFESIRRNLPTNLKLGILSGSIVLIPSASEELLKECINDCEIDIRTVKIRQTSFSPDYATVDVKGINKEKIVLIMTELFTRGGIYVIVGTTALLGEGWDAPSINSLLLASFVGSYMLSNQMRGRAIRTEPNNPQKTANVWHLACVEPKSSLDEDEINEDLRIILRRFKGFVGPSFKEPLIESGVSRLDIGDPPYTNEEVISINETMSDRARNRDKMRTEWEIALRRGDDGVKLVENIKLQKEHLPRGLIFENTIESVFKQGVLFFLFIFLLALYTFGEVILYSLFSSISWFFILLLAILLISILAGFPKFLKAIWLFIRHGSVKSSLNQISKTLLKSLCLTGLIKTDFNEIKIKIDKGEAGVIFCHLDGSTNREKIIFLESLQEILDPIQNPRYLLVRKSLIFNHFGRFDYHAVPSVIGTKKRHVLLFAELWDKFVGEMELIYTRSRQGRESLLKARNHSLSAHFRTPTQRISRWC